MRGYETSHRPATEGADPRTRAALEKGLASAEEALAEPSSPPLRCYAEAVADEVRIIARGLRLYDLIVRAEAIIAQAEAEDADEDDLGLIAPGV